MMNNLTKNPRTELGYKLSQKLKMWTILLASSALLAGCSTISKVTDAVNPFNGSKEADQGDIPTDPERISILTLDDNLEIKGTILPSEIVLPPAYTNPDWPQTGGYATHSVQHTNAPGTLSRLWQKSVGKGSYRKGRVVASPVVAGGRIYTMDAANRISALDAETGSKIWDYKIAVTSKGKTRRGKTSIIDRIKDPLTLGEKGGKDKEAVGGGVAVADGRVFATSGFGVIMAFDAVSGNEIWTTRTRTPIHSAPTVKDGRLFAVSDDNELFALNSNTGEVLWTYQAIIETARMLTAPSPAVIDDVVIAPFSSGEVVALKAQNGGVLWQEALDASGNLTPLATLNDIAAGPVIADGYVFATTQSGAFTAFDLRTGQQVWNQPAGSLGFPMVAGDFVYTVTTDGQVVCMSKTDGTVIWLTQLQTFKKQKKRKKRISWAGPILAGERLLMMSSRGEAVEVNPYTGEIIRTFKLAGDIYVAPIIANNTVYYITDDAKLVALR
ncbi:MAG: PQQ-binding-like beta-propeller repeat protein [Robiginitomaculum sp.]|nr:PQQ-binding-like beta-propeller repeat protein [Robiginitomaculum sp.]